MDYTVTFYRLSDLGPTSDYTVTVTVDNRVIHADRVNDHWRDDGWEVLVEKFGRQLKKQWETEV